MGAVTEAAGISTAEALDKGRAAMLLAADAVWIGALAGDNIGALAGATAPVAVLLGWSATVAALALLDAATIAALLGWNVTMAALALLDAQGRSVVHLHYPKPLLDTDTSDLQNENFMGLTDSHLVVHAVSFTYLRKIFYLRACKMIEI